MLEKIGVGVITCNRPEFFKSCFNSLPREKIDELVVVNDGDVIERPGSISPQQYIQHTSNRGVGISKNDALKYLVDKQCTHIFLIEDDIIIKRADVFEQYIKASKQTGLSHFMFGYHGPANKRNGVPHPRLVVDYPDGVSINLNTHCVGAFCYYTRELLAEVGYMDEVYINALEHIDHSYLIVKHGGIPAYWWWPDISISCDLLTEQACSEVNSSIRPRPDWRQNIQTGAAHFFQKHKIGFTSVPDSTESDILKKLKQIHANKKASGFMM